MTNPYNKALDPDTYEIWEILVRRDIEAFENSNWNSTALDFSKDRFCAIHAHYSNEPDDWDLCYGSLQDYAKDWLEQRKDFDKNNKSIALAKDLYEATFIDKIEIKENTAIVHKRFNGEIRMEDLKDNISLQWKSIYQLQKTDKWYIIGFVGYMPVSK